MWTNIFFARVFSFSTQWTPRQLRLSSPRHKPIRRLLKRAQRPMRRPGQQHGRLVLTQHSYQWVNPCPVNLYNVQHVLRKTSETWDLNISWSKHALCSHYCNKRYVINSAKLNSWAELALPFTIFKDDCTKRKELIVGPGPSWSSDQMRIPLHNPRYRIVSLIPKKCFIRVFLELSCIALSWKRWTENFFFLSCHKGNAPYLTHHIIYF